jgi:hypothetical protein
MPVLRLGQTNEGGDAYRVLLEFEADGQRREDTRQFKSSSGRPPRRRAVRFTVHV